MKARALSLLALALLLPAAAGAQEPSQDTTKLLEKKAPVMKIVRLTERDVSRALPMLNGELTGMIPEGNAVSGMTRTEYINVKNALIVARLDFLDPSRLQLPFDDGSLQVRRNNADYYRVNQGRLEQLLLRAKPDKSCKLCGLPQ